MLVDLGEYCIGPGVYFGILAQCYHFEGQTRYSVPAKWESVKWIGRLILTCALAAPFWSLAHFLSYDSLPNPYLFTLVDKLIPLTIDAYLVFAFSDTLCAYCGLLDTVDPNKASEEEIKVRMVNHSDAI